jgi:hypothetical protein
MPVATEIASTRHRIRCSHCRIRKVLARGLCQACYHRLRRNGTVIRKNVRNTGRCAVRGCRERAFAKGLCNIHYYRQRHPLTNRWKLIRSRYSDQTPVSWNRFERFLDDVGEAPSPKHQLRRTDESKPYSKSNVEWVRPITVRKQGYFTPAQRRAYIREWTLVRKFNLTSEAYRGMLRRQRGVCAICRTRECFINRRTGRTQALSVDHNHDTGAVRGLLCVRCNRMLGYAKDSPKILRNAIFYLQQHA